MMFKDHGYSPSNFAALVAASGCKTNLQFMADNNISKPMFYRYLNGEVSIDWQTWQALVKKYGANDGKA